MSKKQQYVIGSHGILHVGQYSPGIGLRHMPLTESSRDLVSAIKASLGQRQIMFATGGMQPEEALDLLKRGFSPERDFLPGALNSDWYVYSVDEDAVFLLPYGCLDFSIQPWGKNNLAPANILTADSSDPATFRDAINGDINAIQKVLYETQHNVKGKPMKDGHGHTVCVVLAHTYLGQGVKYPTMSQWSHLLAHSEPGNLTGGEHDLGSGLVARVVPGVELIADSNTYVLIGLEQ